MRNAAAIRKDKETRVRGRAVSRGISIGKVSQLAGTRLQFPRTNIEQAHVPDEIKRLRRAISSAKTQFNSLLKKHGASTANSQRQIIEAQLLMLEDPTYVGEIQKTVSSERVSFEWAAAHVTEKLRRRFENISDGAFHEKALDLQDVCNKILSSAPTLREIHELPKDTVVVAREISPTTLIELSRSGVNGIITERGGWTSHTFILARELGITAVTGVKNASRVLKDGVTVIVDGFSGLVVVSPGQATMKAHAGTGNRKVDISFVRKPSPRNARLTTLDGFPVDIRVNLDRVENYERARKSGAHGVGLFRSELLLESRNKFLTESEQARRYIELVKSARGELVNIRTFDFDLNSFLLGAHDDFERNPALGLRGIRWNFVDQKRFRQQLSALLRAAHYGDLGIVIPMISDLNEISFARNTIEREKRRLKRLGVKFGKVRIGAMIEVPSSAILCDVILREVDFLCLGTNDLVQYLLAVDRDNESVAKFFRTLHPAVLRTLKSVFASADSHGKPITVCGEMAGSPFYAPILVGLGAKDLSMNSRAIPKIREAISNIALDEAHEIANGLLACLTADQAEKLLHRFLKKTWRHITGFELSS